MALKLRKRSLFPAIVTAESPITLTKDGAAFNFGLSINDLRTSLDQYYVPSETEIPLSILAEQSAFTLVGNNTDAPASPTAVDIATLTTKASPSAGDYVMISDQDEDGAWKKATIASVSSPGEVGAAATMSDLLAGAAATFPDSLLLFQLMIADSLIQNNTTDANNDIDVLLDGSAVVTKRLDAVWAAGTNQGGLDTGSKAINSTYHLYLLHKNSDGTLDALFSASATAPTIPSGYTKVRVLGAVTTDGSGNIRAFQQFGDYFQLVVGVREASAVSVNPSATFITLTAVPHGVKVMARFFFDIANAGGAGGYGSCWDADLGIGADVSGAKLAVLIHTTGLTEAGGQVTCPTSAAGQIAVYDSASGSTVTISTQGWYDPRVRRHAI